MEGSYRFKNPLFIVYEIEWLINKHDADWFMFVDAVFSVPKMHAVEIFREIIIL